MAKYTIKMSCGHEDVVEILGRESDRRQKIKYFEESGLCKECYRKRTEKQKEETGLTFHTAILPRIDPADGEPIYYVWFADNTRPHKDAIKSLGYHWQENETQGDLHPQFVWAKEVKAENLDDETAKAEKIGAKIIKLNKKDMDFITDYKIAMEMRNKWLKKKEEIGSIEKPVAPSILVGHKWNGKIYGRSGNRSIYLDGNKVNIDEDQAQELEEYFNKKQEYYKKVEELKYV